MIILTRLDGKHVAVNEDLLAFAEQTPDTVLTMTSGHRLMVKEPLAEIIEKGTLKFPSKEDATVGNTSIVDVVAMNQMARPFGVSFRNSVTLTGVLDWISDVTGLRGSFNKALTGDPRGICMHRDCDKYRQTVGIGTTGSATWIATALAMDEKVVLDKLIERTLEKALEPLQSK